MIPIPIRAVTRVSLAAVVVAATLSLGAGIAVTGLIAFAAAAQLAYWIPRAGARRVVR